MKLELIRTYFEEFNKCVYEAKGIEFWFARDIQNLLGYSKWENFLNVIEKAKEACKNSGVNVEDNFANTVRAVNMPNGGIKEVDDIFLTRYACYLIAQNGDSTKEPIAFAMSYFAIQTRKQEILEKRINDFERIQAREKLSFSEKKLSGVVYEKGVDNTGFAVIRSKGDQALFGGFTTNDMKNRLGIPKSRPLADFLPTITIKAKDFANEITIFNLKKDNAPTGLSGISHEHEINNRDVRNLLLQRGIHPESLPAEEDAQKVKRKIQSENKKLLKETKKGNKK
ncbi:MAG: DNA damage-inducible protein D [bacterium]|nr:DNA damage-inducible protein D [bacterium]